MDEPSRFKRTLEVSENVYRLLKQRADFKNLSVSDYVASLAASARKASS